jgi:hypothetical protein
MRGEERLDALPVQPRFGRQCEPHEVKSVAQAQAEMPAVPNVAVAVDDVRPVVEQVARIEGEEFVFNGDSRNCPKCPGRAPPRCG